MNDMPVVHKLLVVLLVSLIVCLNEMKPLRYKQPLSYLSRWTLTRRGEGDIKIQSQLEGARRLVAEQQTCVRNHWQRLTGRTSEHEGVTLSPQAGTVKFGICHASGKWLRRRSFVVNCLIPRTYKQVITGVGDVQALHTAASMLHLSRLIVIILSFLIDGHCPSYKHISGTFIYL